MADPLWSARALASLTAQDDYLRPLNPVAADDMPDRPESLPVGAEAPVPASRPEVKEKRPVARSRSTARGGGDSRDHRDREGRVVGMGDYLPSFIALSFEDRASE